MVTILTLAIFSRPRDADLAIDEVMLSFTERVRLMMLVENGFKIIKGTDALGL